MLQQLLRICNEKLLSSTVFDSTIARSVAVQLAGVPARGASSSSAKHADEVAAVQTEAERKRAQLRLQRQQKSQSLQLSSLRKQWAAEHADMLQKRQQAHQEFVKQNEARSAAKQAERTKDAAKGQTAMKAAQTAAAQRKEVEQVRAAHRRRAREQIYALSDHDRRQWLEEQSRNWIAADQLDQRIQWALDNPQQLGGEVNTFAQAMAAPQAAQDTPQQQQSQPQKQSP